MPSLGFLKKKRTRPEDPNSTSQPTSPVTPTTSSAPRSFDHAAALSSQPAPAVQPVDSQLHKVAPASGPPQGEKVAMNPATAHYPSNHAAPHSPSPGTDPNGLAPGVLPSIANLIHPQSDAAPQQQHAQQQQQPEQQQQQQSLPTDRLSLNQQQQQAQFPAPPANGGGIAPSATTQPQQTSTMPQQQPTPAQTPQAQAQAAARQTKGKYSLADFEILRTLGTGSFGRVHLVQSRHNQRFYAVKVLKKAQVVKMKQVEHTNDERKMLGEVKHPFLITLWGTFQDSRNLYMVMDFVEGGELFSLLRKSGVCSILPEMLPTILIYKWKGMASILLGPLLTLYLPLALPQPGCQILRRRGHACSRIPTRKKYHIQRPEAREPTPRSAWASQDHRLWLCEESARQDMDALWYP